VNFDGKKNSYHSKILASRTAIAAIRGAAAVWERSGFQHAPTTYKVGLFICCMAYRPRHLVRATPSLPSPSRRLPRIATQPAVVDDTCSCFSIICRSPTGPGSRVSRGLGFCHSKSAFSEINVTFVGSASRIFDGERHIWQHR